MITNYTDNTSKVATIATSAAIDHETDTSITDDDIDNTATGDYATGDATTTTTATGDYASGYATAATDRIPLGWCWHGPLFPYLTLLINIISSRKFTV